PFAASKMPLRPDNSYNIVSCNYWVLDYQITIVRRKA
ncbi:MAG: hypothetical protein ACJAZF_004045, partial [Granulosicoccus sp.]